MDIAVVGLGRMGANMARRLLGGGHRVVVANRSRPPIEALATEGAVPAWTYEEILTLLAPPRAVWLMLPAGGPTDEFIERFAELLSPNDLVVDGGNSYYKDSLRHAELLRARGLRFVDSGTSGGVWGLAEGYSLMVGGDADSVARLRPALETLAPAPDKGWGHVGPAGAGHFVKMVHNGIEYGMMEAYAEGFEILKAKEEFALDNRQIAEIWQYGSVVRSWLLDLAVAALTADPELADLKGYVEDSGEGRWTVTEAIDHDIPAPVITMSLLMRFASRRDDTYSAKMLAALRREFGGHAVQAEGPAGGGVS